jgi:hypothetical protein
MGRLHHARAAVDHHAEARRADGATRGGDVVRGTPQPVLVGTARADGERGAPVEKLASALDARRGGDERATDALGEGGREVGAVRVRGARHASHDGQTVLPGIGVRIGVSVAGSRVRPRFDGRSYARLGSRAQLRQDGRARPTTGRGTGDRRESCEGYQRAHGGPPKAPIAPVRVGAASWPTSLRKAAQCEGVTEHVAVHVAKVTRPGPDERSGRSPHARHAVVSARDRDRVRVAVAALLCVGRVARATGRPGGGASHASVMSVALATVERHALRRRADGATCRGDIVGQGSVTLEPVLVGTALAAGPWPFKRAPPETVGPGTAGRASRAEVPPRTPDSHSGRRSAKRLDSPRLRVRRGGNKKASPRGSSPARGPAHVAPRRRSLAWRRAGAHSTPA